MSKVYKVFAIAAIVTIIATYIDILWHQNDGMYGGEVKHTLPTTRAVVRIIEEAATK